MGQLTNDLAERTKDKACLVTAFDVCNPIDTRTEWLADHGNDLQRVGA